MRRSHSLRRTCLALCLSVSFVEAGEPGTKERADELFQQGRALLEEGAYAEACHAFAESMRLDPGGGTLLNLALCHELEGKLATAAKEYRRALERATEDRREDRVQLARKRLAVVLTRVALFSIDLEDPRGATVTMDGVELDASELGRPVPLDPGPHHLVVSIPGMKPFEHHLEVPREPAWRGSIHVPRASAPPLPPPVAKPPPAVEPAGHDIASMRIPRQPAGEPEARRTTWHWVGLGVGAAGLATAAVTGTMALVADADAEEQCIPERGYCSASGKEAADRANGFAWASSVSLGAALAGMAAWMWLPMDEARETNVGASVAPGGGIVLTTRGTF